MERSESNRLDMFVTMLLPVAARIRMPIECVNERTHRIVIWKFVPGIRPLVLGQFNLGIYALELRLCVGSLCVRRLNFIALQEANGINHLASLH